MKELLLSIIIPVYNVEKYILSCLESVFKQELNENEFEVILVDDGCTDNTMNIVSDFIKLHTNIILIHQTNQGPSIARNKGIQKAKGKYILFVDSDDLLIVNSIKPMLNIAIEKDLDILKSNAVIIDNKEVLKGNIPQNANWDNRPYEIIDGETGFISYYDSKEPWLYINLFRRTFLLNNNLFLKDDISVGEDLLMTVQTYLKAKRLLAIPYTHYIYRRNTTSIMSTININRLLNLNSVLLCLCKLGKEHKLSSKGNIKLEEVIFNCFSIVMWYLSHYTSLYPQRKEVIADLREKCPNLSFNGNIKQRLTTFFYKYIPSVYISFRYLTAKHKYNQ